MSTISGDMDPKPPRWLESDREALEELGYTLAAPEGSASEYARRTDEIGLEFLRLQLTDPDQAHREVPNYLRRFGDFNRNAGILSRLTAEQFGLIVNIASQSYNPDDDAERGHFLYAQVDEYLAGKNSANIGGFTAQLRKPELLRDLVAHWSAVNWPYINGYSNFLMQDNTEWINVVEHMNEPENNPLMFALAIPRPTTPRLIQERFREAYPETAQNGIDILAAALFNGGAHDELLREKYTEDYPEKSNRYKDWESSIEDALEFYGENYRDDILAAITEAKWHVYDDVEFNFPGLPEKLLNTSFSIGDDGKLVRHTH